jgi:poly(A) polymerase
MTRIAPGWISEPATARIMAALAPADPHFVGGCVRDALMGRTSTDIDIAVRAPPEETMRLARAAGLAAYPTGFDHGVVTVMVDGASFEATTLRRDVATDGRRAVIAFANTLAEDAQRRDFTMNALYADVGGTVTDPTGEGLADLSARRIRFIGDADQRIEEDFLRILRFFRFHAQFGIAEFDEEARSSCHRHASGLRQISGERILAEMQKLLASPDPEPALTEMGDILTTAMPGAKLFIGLVEVEVANNVAASVIRRFAALGGYHDLPLSRAQRRALEMIERAKSLLDEDVALAAVAWRCGEGAARDALVLIHAGGVPLSEDWRDKIARGGAAVFPVSAQELIDRGMVPGPNLGAHIKTLETIWMASDLRLSAAELLADQS